VKNTLWVRPQKSIYHGQAVPTFCVFWLGWHVFWKKIAGWQLLFNSRGILLLNRLWQRHLWSRTVCVHLLRYIWVMAGRTMESGSHILFHSCWYDWLNISSQSFCLTLKAPRAFAFWKLFSGYTRHHSIFNVTINSAAVLKHPRLKFTGNAIVTLRFFFVDLQ